MLPLKVELTLVVKTYDVDFVGIVHNAVYIRWLEDLRTQILDEHLPMEQLLAEGISPILTRTEVDYHWPLRLGDRPTGRMWVAKLSRTRWMVEAEIVLDEKLVASAVQFGYFASLETMRPVRAPEPLRRLWQQQTELSSTS